MLRFLCSRLASGNQRERERRVTEVGDETALFESKYYSHTPKKCSDCLPNCLLRIHMTVPSFSSQFRLNSTTITNGGESGHDSGLVQLRSDYHIFDDDTVHSHISTLNIQLQKSHHGNKHILHTRPIGFNMRVVLVRECRARQSEFPLNWNRGW